MSVFTDLLGLLRRPVAPVVVTEPTKGRGKVALPSQPATEPELLAALAQLEAERRVAEDAAIEAANRRERLLLEPDADDAIHGAGRDLDAAQLLIERLDRIEPELRTRLEDLRADERDARWIDLRDAYVAAGDRHLVAVRAFEAEWRPEMERVRAGLLAEFYPSVEQAAGHTPPFVPRFLLPAPDGVDGFAAALDRLRGTVFAARGSSPAPFLRMPDIIADALKSGVLPENASPEMRRAFGIEARVQFPVAIRDGQDVPRAAGEVVTMPGDAAAAEVASGRAVRMEG